MNDLLKIDSNFQYSINIDYDLNDDTKLQSFIPTRENLEIIQDILGSVFSSHDRARILIGSYGKGKSHTILALLALLMKKDLGCFSKLVPVLQEWDELSHLIQCYYDSSQKLLPVIINGSNSSLTQAFVLGLKRSLKDNHLEDIMPESSYKSAAETLRKWKKDYPQTFENFGNEVGENPDQFIERLENYDSGAYQDFLEVFPSLTSGSEFNPYFGFDVPDIFSAVVKSLKTKGYSGIFVVYDEFSKFLESNIADTAISDIKMLQDFAEKCNRSSIDEQLHLLLISHKEISNYIDILPKDKTDGWRGVSERFKHVRMNGDYSQCYELISAVLEKDEEKWCQFREVNKEQFELEKQVYREHPLFKTMNDTTYSQVIYGCYPLNPITAYILTRLSEKVAQNERTIFTFLSANGKDTLTDHLAKLDDKEFGLVRPDCLFDYFEISFSHEPLNSPIHQTYLLTKRLLEKTLNNPGATRILKTISLLYILEQFEVLKASRDEISLIYWHEFSADQLREIFDFLIDEAKVVYLRESDGFLQLKKSSEVDLDELIRTQIEKENTKYDLSMSLNNLEFSKYFYPSRYNDEFEMTRWFKFEFLDSGKLDDPDFLKIYEKNNPADGCILGVIPKKDIDFEESKNLILERSKDLARTVFILPKKTTDITSILSRYLAVYHLLQEYAEDEVLFEELSIIESDVKRVLNQFIRSYIHPEAGQAFYFHKGRRENIRRRAEFSELLSEICHVVYPKSPIINNEFINKNELTKNTVNSIRKIINGLLEDNLRENIGLSGNGQEVAVFRSVLLRTGILTNNNEQWELQLDCKNESCSLVLQTINDFLGSNNDHKTFGELYQILQSPEFGFGMRRGIIPIFLAVILRLNRDRIVLKQGMLEIETNADNLILLNTNPERYGFEIIQSSIERDEYLEGLLQLFSSSDENITNLHKKVALAADGMNRWMLSLSKYARDLTLQENPNARRYKRLIRKLKISNNDFHFIFEEIPEVFGKDLTFLQLLEQIRLFKETYDQSLNVLIQRLIELTKKLFQDSDDPNEQTLSSILVDWTQKLYPGTTEHLFNNGTEQFFKLIALNLQNEEELIRKIAKLMTGLYVEDWNEKTELRYFEKLDEIKQGAENYKGTEENLDIDSINPSSYSLSFMTSSGNTETYHFDQVEIGKRGKLLYNAIVTDISDMGFSISDQEKREIVLRVLQSLC